jgi:hypothetical protein
MKKKWGNPPVGWLACSIHRAANNIEFSLNSPSYVLSTAKNLANSQSACAPPRLTYSREKGRGETSICWQTQSVHNTPMLEQVDIL